MIFGLLFILAFLAGVLIYFYARNWVPAVVVPMLLFLLSVLSDGAARDAWGITLVFGLPIVFVGSLLGTYIVQIRTIQPEDVAAEQVDKQTDRGD